MNNADFAATAVRGPLRLSVLALAALALQSAVSTAQAVGLAPGRFQRDGWRTTCWKGDDGFAANCRSEKRVGRFRLHLAVADDQFTQWIEHPACAAHPDSSVFRDELFARSEEQRRSWVIANFGRISDDLARACPKLPRLDRRSFERPPDIAVADENDAG